MVARATVIVLSHFHVCERDRYSACIAHLQQRSSQSHPQHSTHLWWHPHTPTLSLFREKPVQARTTSASDEDPEKGKMNWPFWSKHPLSLRLAPQRQVPLLTCLPLPHATVLQRKKKCLHSQSKYCARTYTRQSWHLLYFWHFLIECVNRPPPHTHPTTPLFPHYTHKPEQHTATTQFYSEIWKRRLARKVNEISNVA